MLPAATGPTFHAIVWFSGDRDLAWPGSKMDPEGARDQDNSVVAEPDSPRRFSD